MPYNPYSPGGPMSSTPRDLSHTPLGHRLDNIIREAQAAAKSREANRDTSTAIPVTLTRDSARGRRYTDEDGEMVLARPGTGVWEVYPCGPRGGIQGALLGSGTTPQDALEDAGYREVAR